jgi:hypothetical protein
MDLAADRAAGSAALISCRDQAGMASAPDRGDELDRVPVVSALVMVAGFSSSWLPGYFGLWLPALAFFTAFQRALAAAEATSLRSFSVMVTKRRLPPI